MSERIASLLNRICVSPVLSVTVGLVVSSLLHLHLVSVEMYVFYISSRVSVWNIWSCAVDVEPLGASRLFLTVMS